MAFLIVLIILVAIGIHWLFKVPNIPVLNEVYWGPGEGKNVDSPIVEFKINVSKEVFIGTVFNINLHCVCYLFELL